MRAAIDIGGTFTDVLLYDEETGALWTAKVPSSTQQPAHAFMLGLHLALDSAESELSNVNALVHGTTIVTNTLLEGKTASVGLLVTKGFRDLLEIGRQQRPQLYDLMADRRAPLVPRHRVREAQERVGADGREVVPLAVETARDQIRALEALGVESLAIVLLFSFLNPDNENKLGELAQEFFPERSIFLSCQISPEFREFERASTTVVAAAVAPKVLSYLQAIRGKLDALGWQRDALYIMHSGGGTLPPQEAMRKPHTMVESGPAAGIIATGQLAQTLGLEQVIAFDMGGTTAKAGLVLNGHPLYATECEVGGEMHQAGRARSSGYPVRFPMIDMAECGAGAGSIAWIDSGGHLKVGPKSAGADPGPACYGKDGDQPTVTDAYLALGYLDPGSFLGGDMSLDPKLATQALHEHVCKPMNMKLPEAALGVVTIANANMLRILRLVSIERGHDPRDFTLVAYGGAGPLHATMLAEKLAIRRVIVPRFPGLFSALGLLNADVTTDFVETVMVTLTPENLDRFNAALDGLSAKADNWLQRVSVPGEKCMIKVSADLRYLRQNYELSIPLPGAHISLEDIGTIQTQFHEAHMLEYGHSTLGETIQVVYVRLQAVKPMPKPDMKPLDDVCGTVIAASDESRFVWFSGGWIQCQVYQRDDLKAGQTLEGPAIIQEKEATTLVERGWCLRVDKFGNLLVEKD
ncbi:MAG: hydantoinase/oxoprolinase family protein [Chloroflexota bacterium]|nr:hydantoinase/oxoprolinase family protein [Chloroflexota bacterium]